MENISANFVLKFLAGCLKMVFSVKTKLLLTVISITRKFGSEMKFEI